jgi:hypothetical protein
MGSLKLSRFKILYDLLENLNVFLEAFSDLINPIIERVEKIIILTKKTSVPEEFADLITLCRKYFKIIANSNIRSLLKNESENIVLIEKNLHVLKKTFSSLLQIIIDIGEIKQVKIEKKENLMSPTVESGLVKEQAQNTTAINVLLQIKHKLIGLNLGKPFDCEEQVEYLIQQATNEKNLALMFQGWMSWF